MKISVLKKVSHRGCTIVIRRIGENIFEYITSIGGDVYSAYVYVRKPFFRKIVFMDFSEKQILDVVNWQLQAGCSTIDIILDKHNN